MERTLELAGHAELLARGATATEGRGVRILAYAGGVFQPSDWPGPVIIDLAGLELPADVPLLADHQNSLQALAGRGTPEVRNGQLVLQGRLLDTEAGRLVSSLLDHGPVGVSVGVQVLASTAPKSATLHLNGRTVPVEKNLAVVTRARLREVSFVAVPADQEAQAVKAKAKKGLTMDTQPAQPMGTQALEPHGQAPPPQPGARPALVFGPAEVEILAGLSPELRAQVLEGKLPLLQAAELHGLRSSRPQAPRYRAMHDPPVDLQAVAEAALLRTLNVDPKRLEAWYGPNVLELADSPEWRNLGINRLFARAYSVGTGRPEPARLSDEVLRDVLWGRTLQAGWSLIDVPVALGAVVEKVSLDAFLRVSTAWRSVARISSVADFNEAKRFRLTAAGAFQELGKGGEIKHGVLTEEAYGLQANTYGRMFTITRQDIINDRTGSLAQIPEMLGAAAARVIEEKVFSAINAESGFFTAARGNLQSGAALSLDTYGGAVKLLRQQKDSAGAYCLFEPSKLLVPPALEAKGREILQSTAVVVTGTSTSRQGAGNVWAGSADLVTTPYLSTGAGGNDTTWYLLTDPAVAAIVEVGFLNGRQGPVVESAEADFNVLGVGFRGYFDFGVALSEYRAGVKNTA